MSALWTEGTAPQLIGGRDRVSGRVVFPMPEGADGARFDAVPLGRTGTIWSWTVQRFPPKSPPYLGPQPFEPFAVAYVELPEVIVETRLDGVAFDRLKVGLPVELAIVPFGGGETFAFREAA